MLVYQYCSIFLSCEVLPHLSIISSYDACLVDIFAFGSLVVEVYNNSVLLKKGNNTVSTWNLPKLIRKQPVFAIDSVFSVLTEPDPEQITFAVQVEEFLVLTAGTIIFVIQISGVNREELLLTTKYDYSACVSSVAALSYCGDIFICTACWDCKILVRKYANNAFMAEMALDMQVTSMKFIVVTERIFLICTTFHDLKIFELQLSANQFVFFQSYTILNGAIVDVNSNCVQSFCFVLSSPGDYDGKSGALFSLEWNDCFLFRLVEIQIPADLRFVNQLSILKLPAKCNLTTIKRDGERQSLLGFADGRLFVSSVSFVEKFSFSEFPACEGQIYNLSYWIDESMLLTSMFKKDRHRISMFQIQQGRLREARALHLQSSLPLVTCAFKKFFYFIF